MPPPLSALVREAADVVDAALQVRADTLDVLSALGAALDERVAHAQAMAAQGYPPSAEFADQVAAARVALAFQAARLD